jgi:hypothetical protein
VTCPEDDPRFCLPDHVLPHLDGWTRSPTIPNQYYARCPAHGGHKRSLGIRVGDQGRRIVWNCRADCSQAEVRAAMVAAGVPDGCLPGVRGQRTEDALRSAIIAAFRTVRPGRERELAILAAVFGEPRSKAALVRLAERFGIPRSTAYRVTDMSNGRTNVTAMRRLTPSSHRTPRPATGQERDASTCAFDAIHHTGVHNQVGPEGRPRAPLSITPAPVPRCRLCDGEITGRRADAGYCSRSCQQKAWRKAQAASEATTPAPEEEDAPMGGAGPACESCGAAVSPLRRAQTAARGAVVCVRCEAGKTVCEGCGAPVPELDRALGVPCGQCGGSGVPPPGGSITARERRRDQC